LELTAGGRVADGYAEQDGFPPPTYFVFTDTNEYQKSRIWSGFGSAKYRADAFEAKLGYAISETKRDNFDPAFGSDPGFSSQGRSERLNLNGAVYLGGDSSLKLGAENVHDIYQTGPFGSSGSTGSKGAYILFDMAQNYAGWDSHALAIGARIDDHKQFGTHTSFGANGRYFLTHWVSLRGSVQTGFKAPTLFQLLSDYGNLSLNPETSFGFDLTLALGDRNGINTGGPVSASIGLFNRLTSNQIDFISCFGLATGICTNRPYGTYDNIKRTRASGIEAEARWWAGERLNFQGTYSYVDARNRSIGNANFGKELARRPQHVLSASADWNSKNIISGDGISLGADIRYASRAFDDNGNSRRLADYTLVTLRGSIPITDQFALYARVENLFDTQNQTASEYGSYGRGFFAGIRAAF
jgi:vitamin B12 transporter